ncbi:MAG: gluconolactonase, partial [Mesotoga sp.]|nr:gluconolactonase [Mesotoga sp.]
MKRPITLVFLLAAAVLCGNVSYNTYTVGIGWFLVKSQAAFEPTEVLYGEFLSPEDLFVRDGKLYVADSGNSRIAVLDGKEVSYLAEWEVLNPQGIYVDESGALYIADSWARNVYKYDGRGVQTGVLTRPDSPLYGKSNDFIPLKVAADRR